VRQIGLIILAAGSSSRLGSPKQLLQFQGRTLLRRATETALGSGCRPVVVVLGDKPELLESQLSDLSVIIARNPNWGTGMGSSIRAGLEILLSRHRGPIEAVIFMVCDQPFIGSSDIDRLCSANVETGCGVISSTYEGVWGVPVLFTSKYFSELEQLPPSEGARRIIARHGSDHHSIDLPAAAFDVDTPEDYRKLIEKDEADAPSVN
jgi:molybdenum cofactor cytidylyltransferase